MITLEQVELFTIMQDGNKLGEIGPSFCKGVKTYTVYDSSIAGNNDVGRGFHTVRQAFEFALTHFSDVEMFTVNLVVADNGQRFYAKEKS